MQHTATMVTINRYGKEIQRTIYYDRETQDPDVVAEKLAKRYKEELLDCEVD